MRPTNGQAKAGLGAGYSGTGLGSVPNSMAKYLHKNHINTPGSKTTDIELGHTERNMGDGYGAVQDMAYRDKLRDSPSNISTTQDSDTDAIIDIDTATYYSSAFNVFEYPYQFLVISVPVLLECAVLTYLERYSEYFYMQFRLCRIYVGLNVSCVVGLLLAFIMTAFAAADGKVRRARLIHGIVCILLAVLLITNLSFHILIARRWGDPGTRQHGLSMYYIFAMGDVLLLIALLVSAARRLCSLSRNLHGTDNAPQMPQQDSGNKLANDLEAADDDESNHFAWFFCCIRHLQGLHFQAASAFIAEILYLTGLFLIHKGLVANVLVIVTWGILQFVAMRQKRILLLLEDRIQVSGADPDEEQALEEIDLDIRRRHANIVRLCTFDALAAVQYLVILTTVEGITRYMITPTPLE